MASHMKSNRPTTTLLLVWLMFGATLVPMVSAAADAGSETEIIASGDLSGFDPETEGHEYLFGDEDEPIFSAFGYLKMQ